MDTPEPRKLRDPRELRAVAHPVRMAIIELLTIDGAMTATELADRLDETPANCSWHLRKLAEHGFVEEAEGGVGRRRPWQVSRVGMSWDSGDADAEVRRAGQALSRMMLERWVDRLMESEQRLADEQDQPWVEASAMGQTGAWLTVEELEEMNRDIREVMFRHFDRVDDPSRRPEGARLCELVAWGVPVDFGQVRR